MDGTESETGPYHLLPPTTVLGDLVNTTPINDLSQFEQFSGWDFHIFSPMVAWTDHLDLSSYQYPSRTPAHTGPVVLWECAKHVLAIGIYSNSVSLRTVELYSPVPPINLSVPKGIHSSFTSDTTQKTVLKHWESSQILCMHRQT